MRRMTLGAHLRRRRNREKGAVATIVTVLLAGGVMMGMLALSVDIGSIMNERRQLQNGADAASMALAQMCAVNDPNCSDANAATAVKPLANANAKDQLSSISSICASGVPTITTTCEAGGAELSKCPPVPGSLPAGTPYVEVKTRTETTSGNTVLTPFARMLTGSSGTTVTSCARAAWGPGGPNSAAVLPLTMSECDWANQVGYPGATNYPAPPDGAWPGYSNTDSRPDWPASEDTVWSKGNDTTCDTSSPGGTAPGGFAWLDGMLGSCSATVTDSTWIHGDTGADGCPDALFRALLGTVIYVPVFDCEMASNPGRDPVATDDCNSGRGNNTYYHITGFAAFYLSGWRLTHGTQNSIRPPNALCGSGNSDRCLSGWFLKDLIPAGQFIPPTSGNPNYGLTVVNPAG
jgi:Flp pilus assembly protein TadG